MSLEWLERKNRGGRCRPIWPGRTAFGFGVFYEDITNEGILSIPDTERSKHVGVIGTTRIGKSRLLEQIVEQDIQKGYSVVVFDPKVDLHLFSKVIEMAAAAGRLDDVLFLSPIFSEHSVHVDPLSSYYIEEELVGHIVSGVPSSGGEGEFFFQTAKELATLVVAGILRLKHRLGEEPRLTFLEVMNRIGYSELRQLRDSLAMIPGSADIVSRIDRVLDTDKDWFMKVTSGLRLTLQELTFGVTGKIIGKATTNEVVARLQRDERIILFCSTGALLTREVSYLVGKVVISMFQSLVGQLFASGKVLSAPLCLHLDEGDTILFRGVQELFNKGGGANVWVAFYTQSLAQIEEKVGAFITKSIIDNMSTWIYMCVNHPETAQHIEDSSPPYRLHEPVMPLGGSPPVIRTELRPLVESHRLQRLPPREFYLRTHQGWGRGVTLDVPDSRIHVTNPDMDYVRARGM